MPCLNVDLDYFEHRKTKRLVGRLGKGAEVLPLKLWTYCGKFHPEDGRLSGYSEQEIASIVGWWRDPSEFAQAMLDIGFLGQDDEGYFVHEWLEHEGHLDAFKKRAKEAADKRWEAVRRAKVIGCSTDATSIAQDEDEQSPNRTNQPTKPKTPSRSAKDEIPDPPESLNTPEFHAAWTLWKKHRAEIKHPLKPTMAARQLADFEQMGVTRAVRMIQHTVSKGWQGLREPDSHEGGTNGASPVSQLANRPAVRVVGS